MTSNLNWYLRRQYLCSDKLQCDVSYTNRMVSNFSCSTQDEYHIHGEMGMPLPPFVARFSPDLLCGNMMGVADEDGHVMLLDTSKTKDTSTIKEWSAHSNAVFDLAWINKEAKLVTASGDQTARLWDVEKTETVAIFRGHTCSLKSVAVQPQSSNIFLTGARDGNILLWDTRSYTRNGFSNPINTIRNAHVLPQKEIVTPSGKKRKARRASMYSVDSKQSVTSVVFQDGNTIISSGACDGALKYWDIRKNYTTHKSDPVAFHVIPFAGKGPRIYGYSSLVLNSSLSRLYAVCTNDIIYEYATGNLSNQPLATYYGHLASSFYVKIALSPDDRFLLCGSGDNHAYVWRTDQPNSPPWLLKGHYGEVTSVAWSPGVGEKVVTCSDDNTFRVWRLFQDADDQNNITGTCEQKTEQVESLKSILPSTVYRESEDIFESKLQRKKCYCKPTDMRSNRKASTRWKFEPLMLSKECQSPVCLTPNASNPINVSPFTVVTPRQTLRQKFLTPTPVKTSNAPSTSTRRTKGATTPRSSRLFMETWLKSPATPKAGNSSNLEKMKEELKDTSNENDTCTLKHKTRASESKESSNTSKPFTKTTTKIEIVPLRTNKEKSIDSKDNTITNLKTTPRLKLNKTKDGGSRRKKRDVSNIKPTGNIKSLLLSSKRKRDSVDCAADEQPAKFTKTDKENELTVGHTINNIEEKTDKIVDLAKNILTENVEKPHKIKDLLDHAEETSS